MIYALCDETFSVNVILNDIEGVDKEDVYFAVTIFNQGYWVLGTWLGALFGGVIPFNTSGLDFVMTAPFIVIFLDYLFKNKQYFSSAMGFILSVATQLTRFIPFFLFPANKKVPRVITYLGKLLPAAVLAMLVIYYFKDYQSYDLPKTISTIVASLVTVGLYFYKKSMLLPIAG